MNSEYTDTGSGSYIRYLSCPECGEPEAWAYAEAPFAINCPRQNNCGVSTKTLSLFPGITKSFHERFPATEADPGKPARKYLNLRGLSGSLDGLEFEHRMVKRKGENGELVDCGGAVMFPVGQAEDGSNILNGRLYNPPKSQGKTHNVGSTKGRTWKHSSYKYNYDEEVVIVEGTVDALSFIEIDIQAIAALSAGQDPKNISLPFKKVALAFDNNPAGAQATKRWKAFLESHGVAVRVITPPKKCGDWNDMLLRFGRDGFREYWNSKQDQLITEGAMLISENASEWVQHYFDYYQSYPRLIEFGGQYYSCTKRETDAGVKMSAKRISNFVLDAEHIQIDTLVPGRPENSFYVAVRIKDEKKKISFLITAEELTGTTLQSAILKRCLGIWKGNKEDAHCLIERITQSRAPRVKQLNATGYNGESDYYFFSDFAISPEGHVITPDKLGLFRGGHQKFYRPFQEKTLRPKRELDCVEIVHLIRSGWGEHGLMLLSWYVACWFVHRVKEVLGFFPFCSVYGEPASGKTSLLTFLNAMQGLGHEGIPFNEINTLKGISRKASQYNSLALSFIEVNAPPNSNEA